MLRVIGSCNATLSRAATYREACRLPQRLGCRAEKPNMINGLFHQSPGFTLSTFKAQPGDKSRLSRSGVFPCGFSGFLDRAFHIEHVVGDLKGQTYGTAV